jgi:hypothetical protein
MPRVKYYMLTIWLSMDCLQVCVLSSQTSSRRAVSYRALTAASMEIRRWCHLACFGMDGVALML